MDHEEFLKAIGDALAMFSPESAEQLPIVRQVVESLKDLHDLALINYRSHGAIYGDEPEGMLRWYRELSEIQMLRMRADVLETHHDMLRNMRRG